MTRQSARVGHTMITACPSGSGNTFVCRLLRVAVLSFVALSTGTHCSQRKKQGQRADASAVPIACELTGMYWARLGHLPEGMRVQLWLESDGIRVRGSYSAVPWNGEIEGRVASRQEIAVRLIERGVTRAVGSRDREVVLHRDPRGTVLSGTDPSGQRVELVRAGFASPTLRPGVWLARWTGLPFGIAVETRLERHPDGHWRAVYQYQGSGGTRDGSFDGRVDSSGTLSIAWTEVSENGTVIRGKGRLAPAPFGLRGTYGIEESTEGTGEWTLEPFEVPENDDGR